MKTEKDHIYTINKPPKSMFYFKITIRDKNHMVSQMAHAKKLCEPVMAHLENLCSIPCLGFSKQTVLA